jgi:hypothetical protein
VGSDDFATEIRAKKKKTIIGRKGENIPSPRPELIFSAGVLHTDALEEIVQ